MLVWSVTVLKIIKKGPNDSSSLKVAHCGISISQTETSIAAPFTSLNDNINCVLNIIKEGKCTISVSFQLLKFILLLSLIQTISCLFLFTINSNFTDFQYLYNGKFYNIIKIDRFIYYYTYFINKY